MVRRCPYCGSIPEQPLLFSRAVQQVFNYIWNHPLCTIEDLDKAFNPSGYTNLTSVNLAKIRAGLKGTTYRLISTDIKRKPGSVGLGRKSYEIVSIDQPESEPSHANV